MWKCPRCETLNDQEKCIICGEPKPIEEEVPKKEPEATPDVVVSKSNEKPNVQQTSRIQAAQGAGNVKVKKEKPVKEKKEKVKKEKPVKEKPAKEKKGGKGKVFLIILIVLALLAAIAAAAVVLLNNFDFDGEDDATEAVEVIYQDEDVEVVTEPETEPEIELETEPETVKPVEEPTEKATKKSEKKTQPSTPKVSECTYCGSTAHTSEQHPICPECGSRYHGGSYHKSEQKYCATCQKYTDHTTYEHSAPSI